MKKILLFTSILFSTFSVLKAQSDTICNPSFEDSLTSWGVISNGGATSTSWTQYTLYTTDSNAVSGLKVKVKPQSSGTYYFDDFLMEAISTLPTNSVVCNSDFEIGLSDWTQSPNGGTINVVSESNIVQNGTSAVKVTVTNTTN